MVIVVVHLNFCIMSFFSLLIGNYWCSFKNQSLTIHLHCRSYNQALLPLPKSVVQWRVSPPSPTAGVRWSWSGAVGLLLGKRTTPLTRWRISSVFGKSRSPFFSYVISVISYLCVSCLLSWGFEENDRGGGGSASPLLACSRHAPLLSRYGVATQEEHVRFVCVLFGSHLRRNTVS